MAFRNPISVTLVALALAITVNIFYFATGNDLTVVVSRTLFADMLLVLTLVPIYRSIQVKAGDTADSLPEKVKAGMKPVAMYTFIMAVVTYVLFEIFGDALVTERLMELEELLNTSELTEDQRADQLAMAGQVYSPASHVLIVLLGNLFTGFVSSILAGMLIRK